MNIELIDVIIFSTVGIITTFFIGISYAKKVILKNNVSKVELIHQNVKSLIKTRNYIGALPLIGKIDSLVENNGEVKNLLGICYSNLNIFDSAAEAYSLAAFYSLGKKDGSSTLFYFNAALMFLKTNNWEFVLNRSESGIRFTTENPQGRYFEGRDLLQDLRVFKLVASIHYFNGSQAFENAKSDALWIIQNSKNVQAVSLAKSYLSFDDNVKRLIFEMDFGTFSVN